MNSFKILCLTLLQIQKKKLALEAHFQSHRNPRFTGIINPCRYSDTQDANGAKCHLKTLSLSRLKAFL